MLHDIRKGITTVLRDPWLWLTLVIASVSTIFLVGPAEAALPLLVKERFGEHVDFYALLTTLSALGSIGAAFWSGHFKRLRRRGLLTSGIAADRFGASLVFVLGGAIAASIIALGLLHPAIRAVD